MSDVGHTHPQLAAMKQHPALGNSVLAQKPGGGCGGACFCSNCLNNQLAQRMGSNPGDTTCFNQTQKA